MHRRVMREVETPGETPLTQINITPQGEGKQNMLNMETIDSSK